MAVPIAGITLCMAVLPAAVTSMTVNSSAMRCALMALWRPAGGAEGGIGSAIGGGLGRAPPSGKRAQRLATRARLC